MECFHPVRIRDPNGCTNDRITVPCGKCFACQSNRRKDWHMRIKYELLHQVCSYTVTLTYDNDHLPRQVLFGEKDILRTGIAELDKVEQDIHMDTVGFWYHPYRLSDVQKFFKRLRKQGLKFRYFGVAEYGGKTARPHYHIIFFFDYYISRIDFQTAVFHNWEHGSQIVIDETNDDCIGYTLKYCLKFYNVKQPQPKIYVSKQPFIGNGYLSDSTVRYLRSSSGDVVHTMSGYQRLPRIIRDKVYDDDMKERNREYMRTVISDLEFKQSQEAERLGLSLEEFRNRKRDSFTDKCVKAIKKKTL